MATIQVFMSSNASKLVSSWRESSGGMVVCQGHVHQEEPLIINILKAVLLLVDDDILYMYDCIRFIYGHYYPRQESGHHPIPLLLKIISSQQYGFS